MRTTEGAGSPAPSRSPIRTSNGQGAFAALVIIAITLWPAEVLGIAGKVGSIEPGKLANLLVTRGDPLDIRSEVKYVFVEGKMVDLGSRNSELYEKFTR